MPEESTSSIPLQLHVETFIGRIAQGLNQKAEFAMHQLHQTSSTPDKITFESNLNSNATVTSKRHFCALFLLSHIPLSSGAGDTFLHNCIDDVTSILWNQTAVKVSIEFTRTFSLQVQTGQDVEVVQIIVVTWIAGSS